VETVDWEEMAVMVVVVRADHQSAFTEAAQLFPLQEIRYQLVLAAPGEHLLEIPVLLVFQCLYFNFIRES
jgi:hypothetical protein